MRARERRSSRHRRRARPCRPRGRRPPCARASAAAPRRTSSNTSAPSWISTPSRAQHGGEPGGEGVRPHVPVLADEEARRSTSADERRLELVQLVAGEDVVGQLVAVARASAPACAARARASSASARRRTPCPACGARTRRRRPHLLDQVEDVVAEPGDRRRAVGVVALVAVRPEAQEPGREPVPVAGLEVERRVADRRARASRTASAPARAAARPARGRASRRWRTRRPLPTRLLSTTVTSYAVPAQVVGAAEAGDAAADDDDPAAHALAPATPAVTWSSIRMPGDREPA